MQSYWLWSMQICTYNTSTQGKNRTIIETSMHVTAFKAKLKLWKSKMLNFQMAPFPSLNEMLEENDVPLE